MNGGVKMSHQNQTNDKSTKNGKDNKSTKNGQNKNGKDAED